MPIGINKKIIGMLKDELNGKMMAKLCGPRSKTYSFWIDCYDDHDYDRNKIINKKSKGTKECVIKRRIKFNDYTDSLFNNKTIPRSQQRFKSDPHIIYTENINKAAMTSNDDKRLQTYDNITTYPHETSVFKVCECKMIVLKKYIEDE